jgi:hypothetical protein
LPPNCSESARGYTSISCQPSSTFLPATTMALIGGCHQPVTQPIGNRPMDLKRTTNRQ